MFRNQSSRIDGRAGAIGYAIGRLCVGIRIGGEPLPAVDRRMLLSADTQESAREAQLKPTSMAHLDPMGERLAMYKPALTRVVPFEGGWGQLVLRIYPSEERVERKLDLNDEKLIKKIGQRSISLPVLDLAGEIVGKRTLTELATERSVKTVQDLLNARLAGSAEEKAPSKRKGPAANGKQPLTVVPGPVEERPPEPETMTSASASTKDKVTFVGRYLESGMAKRIKRTKPKDGEKEGSEEYEQFFIDIADAKLDYSKNRIWGADLERALSEASVKKGDTIQITNLGRTPVDIAGVGKGAKKAFKICFDIKKL
jgi:hypothetical protein